MVFFGSCSASKRVVVDKDTQIVNAEPTVPKSKTDPADEKKERDDQHKVNKNQAENSRDIKVKVKVDTLKWEDISDKNKPITVKQKQKVVFAEGLDMKDEYNIKLLIPLNSDELSNPMESRFVHFYAGALKALELLDEEDIKLNVQVIDTEEGNYRVSENIGMILSENTDLVIGPFERDDVKLLAEECKNK